MLCAEGTEHKLLVKIKLFKALLHFHLLDFRVQKLRLLWKKLFDELGILSDGGITYIQQK